MDVADSKPVVFHPLERREAHIVPGPTLRDWPLSSAPDAPGREPLERALFQALRRRWALACGVGLLLGALGAALTWVLLPPRYTAQATLYVSAQASRGLFTSQEGTEDFGAYQRTQAVVVKSRAVLAAALRQPGVAERQQISEQSQPLRWLTENLKVEAKQAPEILHVSLTGEHAEDLPEILNSVLQAYIQELAAKERLKHPVRVEQLQENYRRLEDALRRKRTLLRDLETSLGVDPPQLLALRYQSALTQLAAVEKEAMQTKIALKGAQLELAFWKQREKDPAAQLETDQNLEQLLAKEPGYQALVMRKMQLEEEVSRVQGLAAPGVRDRMMQTQQKELEAANRELSARRQTLQPLLAAQQRSKLEARTSVLEAQNEAMAAELKRQDQEVKRLAGAIRSPDRATADLESLRDEVNQAEQLLKKVGEQRDMMKVEPPLPLRVSVLESAAVPQTMDVRRHAKTSGLVGLVLCSCAVLGICFLEHRQRRVHAGEDVLHGLGMNLLGSLPTEPRLAGKTRRALRNQTNDNALLTVSMDFVREQLLKNTTPDSLRTLMITSALHDEGKSRLATQLAASLARTSCKVLLLDADMSHPTLQQQFKLPGSGGFAELLRGEIGFDEVEYRAPMHGLWLMPLGQWSDATSTVLAGERGQLLLELLRGRFDFVIVNGAPVLTTSDVLLLGRQADGVIFSIQCEVSQIPLVQDAHQRLGSLGIPVLGAVVSGVRSTTRPTSVAG
jgi:succinoglycan biosynthesis transport protein ExoP